MFLGTIQKLAPQLTETDKFNLEHAVKLHEKKLYSSHEFLYKK